MANLFRCLPVCHSGHLCVQVPFQYLAAKLAQVRITTCINCGGIKIPTVQIPAEASWTSSGTLSELFGSFRTEQRIQILWDFPNVWNLPNPFRTLPWDFAVKLKSLKSSLRELSDPSEAEKATPSKNYRTFRCFRRPLEPCLRSYQIIGPWQQS